MADFSNRFSGARASLTDVKQIGVLLGNLLGVKIIKSEVGIRFCCLFVASSKASARTSKNLAFLCVSSKGTVHRIAPG